VITASQTDELPLYNKIATPRKSSRGANFMVVPMVENAVKAAVIILILSAELPSTKKVNQYSQSKLG
jgi:hypothetical protein